MEQVFEKEVKEVVKEAPKSIMKVSATDLKASDDFAKAIFNKEDSSLITKKDKKLDERRDAIGEPPHGDHLHKEGKKKVEFEEKTEKDVKKNGDVEIKHEKKEKVTDSHGHSNTVKEEEH